MSTAVGKASPPISVIVCTYNRPKLLLRALRSVFRQDWHDFEVIVVDDGSDPPARLPGAGSARIRVLRTDHRGVGAARAAGLSAAQAPFVAYCDDDDEWSPSHLRTLISYLLDHPGVDLVYGDSEWAQEGAPPTRAYSIDPDETPLMYSNYIFASDVVHRTAAAREVGGFDSSLQAHEDWDLWLRMSGTHTLRHLPVVVGVHHWHASCVSAADHWEEWRRVYESHQNRLPQIPFDRTTWQPGRRELLWHSVLSSENSFGYVSRQLLLALERQGCEISLVPARLQVPEGLERFSRPPNWARLGFYFHYNRQPSVMRQCERVVTHSMWDSTGVPAEQVEEINRVARLLYVPCQQNLYSFRECGVRIPIKVLHYGVDANEFPCLVRGQRPYFTFGTYGAFSVRKGIDVLLRAFVDEFGPAEPVRLLLKSSSGVDLCYPDDPRITVTSGFFSHGELLALLSQMDAFILPSRGEGFGLCALEAMSTGLPVIATNWSGPAEYLDSTDSFPLSYRLVDAHGAEAHHTRYYGLWAEPDYEHLRFLMRCLYDHPNEAAEKGRVAAQRVHDYWTWDRPARQICADLDAIANA